MGMSTEGTQDLRRKCFSHEHAVLGGGAKAQLQHRQAKAHGRSEMLCTAIRREITDVHNFVKYVLSYANGCLLRATQCSCASYPLRQASDSR